MQIKHKIRNLFCFILLVNTLSAQELRYRSDLITRESGLSNSSVTCVTKDKFGFVWIGTWNGLNRYDGYDMTVFQSDPLDTSTLSNSNINSLFEDRERLMWIATDNGLNSYDQVSGTFKRYYLYRNSTNQRNNQVNAIAQDETGMIWAGCQDEGLIQLNKSTGSCKNWKNDYSDRSNTVISLLADELDPDFLWLGTADGPFLFKLSTGKFEKLNPLATEYPVSVQVIRQDARGNLYLGTWGNGLIKYNRKTSEFISLVPSGVIRDMAFDGKGNLIFNMSDKGLMSYNLHEGNIEILNRGNVTGNLNSMAVTSIYIENPGIIWLGTIYDGAIKIVSLVNSFKYYNTNRNSEGVPNSGGVTSILEDSKGFLWLGTRSMGLLRVDNDGREYKEFKTRQGLSTNNILSLLEVKEGDERYIWIGTEGGGLNRLNPENGKCSVFKGNKTQDGNLENISVSTMLQYDKDHLLIGTRARNEGQGMYVLNIKTGSLVNFRYNPADITSIGSNNVLKLFKDREGVVWAGTRNGGLNKFIVKNINGITPDETGYFIRYTNDPNDPSTLIDNTIYSIHDDTRNNLWLGTNGGGLTKFDPQSGLFSSHVLEQYLNDHLIYGIVADDNENLWISTSRGIITFNSSTYAAHSFDKYDGLQESAFLYGSYYKSSRGELFFGGIRGCHSFHPDSIRLNLKVPEIVITSFTLSGKKGTTGISAVTGKSVLASKKLTIPYLQNNFAITFSALDYNMPAKNRFRYILEGYDREWTETDARRRYVNYTNLPPGDYIFRVIGSNSDDIWNHAGTSVMIRITPPFWRTTVFYVLLWTVFTGLLGLVIFYAVKKYRRQKKQMELEALSSVQDERKQLRTLIDNIPDLIFIKDRQSRFTLANNKVAVVMGTTPENLIGKTDFDFYTEEVARGFYNDELKIMETGIPMINFEESARDEYGNRAIRSTTKVPIKNQDGVIIGLAGVCRDITKLKKIENQLRKKSEDLQETNRLLENRQKEILIQSEELADQTQNLLMINAELERLNRTKDKFFSIIAHDLRNPFNAIIGFSELLRNDFYDMDDNHKLNVLELINVSSQTAYNLLENLLQWARTQTDKINFNPENFDLHETTASVIDLHGIIARKKGVKMKNCVMENTHVHADKNMVSTVLRNLVSNAIKFSNPDGEIEITVNHRSDMLEVNVVDNGVGMDRESLSKLFRIDTYYSTSGTMGESGTGLGLIICKEFIEKNKGRIRARSTIGLGTTMTFTLNPGEN